jgi:hypothetical protein
MFQADSLEEMRRCEDEEKSFFHVPNLRPTFVLESPSLRVGVKLSLVCLKAWEIRQQSKKPPMKGYRCKSVEDVYDALFAEGERGVSRRGVDTRSGALGC